MTDKFESANLIAGASRMMTDEKSCPQIRRRFNKRTGKWRITVYWATGVEQYAEPDGEKP